MDTYGSENTTELALALIEMQKQMSPAAKDAKNPLIGNNYATLNSVMEACREPLLRNGILLTQIPIPPPDYLGGSYMGLMTKLIQAESGQWQASLTVIPLPKADPQGMVSAITYARRYALTAMLGMITEDDDGEAAKLPHKSNSKSGSATQAQNAPASSRRQTRQAQATQTKTQTDSSSLPELDGVTYQYTTTSDDRQCVIATGNTHPHKEVFRSFSFRWDAQRKFW